MDKKEVLKTLGWSDELIDAYTDASNIFEQVPTVMETAFEEVGIVIDEISSEVIITDDFQKKVLDELDALEKKINGLSIEEIRDKINTSEFKDTFKYYSAIENEICRES